MKTPSHEGQPPLPSITLTPDVQTPEVRTPPCDERTGVRHAVRPDIQGLRALAVSLVVLAHAGVARFSGGYVGVDVFFVISGFLITLLLLRELSTTGGISVRKFYARRALRLLPASTLVVVTTLIGSWLFLSKVRFEEYAGDALSSALYAVNFRLAVTGTDYLAEGSPPSPFQHFWSLAVEEQFYLLWPLLLMFSWGPTRRRGLLAVPLAVLSLVSFGLSILATGGPASWAYFGSHTRFWELGVGALLALFAQRLDRLPAKIVAPMTWVGLSCILLSAVWYDNDTPFPGFYALLPVLGAALVLAGGCSPTPYDARWILARRPVVWLGGLSYSWYLWHWPLLIIGPMALDRPADVRLALVFSALALVLAWATLHLVENPVRFHTAFYGRPGRGLVLGAGLSVGAAVIALTSSLVPPPIDSGKAAPKLKHETATTDPLPRLQQLLETSGTSLPSNLTPALTEIKESQSAVYRDGCHVGYESTQTPPCVYGDPTSDKVVVLFGDSHAAQWFPALNQLALTHDWKLVSLTKASCKAAVVTTIYHGKPYSSCDAWRAKAIAKINALQPSLVIVSSSEAGNPAHPEADLVQQWTNGFRETFDALGESGARVAALLDTPWPKTDAVDCAATYPLQLGRCANHLPQAIQDPTRRKAMRDAAKSAGALVIDPEPWLCTRAGNCPVLAGNALVYRDDSHVSEAYAAAVAPVLGSRLTERFGVELNR